MARTECFRRVMHGPKRLVLHLIEGELPVRPGCVLDFWGVESWLR
jgi:hypothetical protein